MTCGIYMIQNKANGKVYVGQALDIDRRWQQHKRELRGNYHSNKHLQHAWNKDGESNFEFTIICECDEDQLNTMEIAYIAKLRTYDDKVGYNKTYGGDSGRPTEEARKKMSESTKGEKHPNYGKHLPEETRKKISKANKGKIRSEETRKKYSEVNKGRHHSKETKKKRSESLKGENAPWYGKHLPEETRKKMSESHKGKSVGENNPMYGKRGFKNHKSIPVVQLTLDGELVKVYGSLRDAERSGFSYSCINMCTKGKRKTHGGYKWMYLSDYEAMKKEGQEN